MIIENIAMTHLQQSKKVSKSAKRSAMNCLAT